MSDASEAELIALAKKGDAAAFGRAVAPHIPMLIASCRAVVGDYHLAQDVVQQALLVAYKKINYFFEEAEFRTWVRAIAHREALSARRRKVKAGSRCALILEEAVNEIYAAPVLPEPPPMIRALEECLKALRGRMLRAVTGYYYEGKRLGDVAAAMGVTVTAARQLLYRVRLGLKNCVDRRVQAENR